MAVEVGYRIRAGEDQAFLETITRMKAPRRRDGATFWRVYRDLGEPSRYVERFIVTSWADYLHQRARHRGRSCDRGAGARLSGQWRECSHVALHCRALRRRR